MDASCENLTTRTYAMCDPTQVEFCVREDDILTLLRDVEARNLPHLAQLCRLNQQFMEFENALAGKNFVRCSTLFRAMEDAVLQLGGVEKSVVSNCRIQVLQWRGLFASRLEAHFNSMCSFHHKSITTTHTHMSEAVDLWSAFEVLNCMEDKAHRLAAETNARILTPLSIAVLSRQLLDVESSSSWNTSSWSFRECDGEHPSAVESFISVLESFFKHVTTQWGVAAMRYYTPAVWEHAVKYLEPLLHAANPRDIDLSLTFELQLGDQLAALPLYHIIEQRRSGGEDREKILREARQWMLVQDMCTLQVSHETEETGLSALDHELSAHFLPRCSISVNTKRLMDVIREQVLNSNSVVLDDDTQTLIKRLLDLFVMLRPHVNRAKLSSDPVLTAIFYNDCQYLVFHLSALPYCRKDSAQHRSLVVHYIPLLRNLAESHFSAMLTHQESLLDTGSFETQDDMYVVEKQIKETIQLLRTIFSALKVLPEKLLAETREVLCAKLMERMMKSLKSPALKVTQAHYFMNSMQAQLLQLVEPPWKMERPRKACEQFAAALSILATPAEETKQRRRLDAHLIGA